MDYYKQERNIYGHCPYCGEPFRLSDIKLTYGKQPPKDLLSGLLRERDKLSEQIEEIETKIEETKEEYEGKIEIVNERWADKFDNEVDRRIQRRISEIRRDAITRSRAGQLGKTIEKLAPMIPGFGHFPYDVRPIFDPIDFVIFDGYFHGEVDEIVFVEFKTGQSRATPIQNSIRKAIEKKKVFFEEKRMPSETIKMLTRRKVPRLKELIE